MSDETRTITINGDELKPYGKVLFAAVDCPCGGGRFYFNANAPLPWIDYCRQCGRRAEVTPKIDGQRGDDS